MTSTFGVSVRRLGCRCTISWRRRMPRVIVQSLPWTTLAPIHQTTRDVNSKSEQRLMRQFFSEPRITARSFKMSCRPLPLVEASFSVQRYERCCCSTTQGQSLSQSNRKDARCCVKTRTASPLGLSKDFCNGKLVSTYHDYQAITCSEPVKSLVNLWLRWCC